MGDHETALICLNGHVISSGIESTPGVASDCCTSCGTRTISECPSWGEPIRGDCRPPVVIRLFTTPAFCHKCGQPYPWPTLKTEAPRNWLT